VAKERALRRAARLAEAEAARARHVRSQARAARRRALARKLRPRVGRTGRIYARRSRGQRAAIVTGLVGVLVLVWLLVGSLTLRVAITVLVVLVAPALVVLTFDRRI
jgi:Flp pilus assembly protein TadB